MSEARPGSSSLPARQGAPRVFISSTSEDLEPYRAKASAAANAAGLLPIMMEYFTASGARPPLAACLAKVDECDVLVVIVAHRYGWKPKGGRGKSVTWLECLKAVDAGQEVLAFLVDDQCDWPPELRDSHRIGTVVPIASATPQLLAEAQSDTAKLGQFKEWLNGRGIRVRFSNPDDLRGKVESACG